MRRVEKRRLLWYSENRIPDRPVKGELSMNINVLAVGDVVGEPGLSFLEKRLRGIKRHYAIDFTVVNGENASGVGITPQQAERILDAGADVITLGNHTWNRPEIEDYLDDCPLIIRPANYAPQVPGRGWGIFESKAGPVLVMNLIGRCGMEFGPDNPFFRADAILKKNPGVRLVLVDMHAEATSEKLALGYYLDGRVSAVFGTHTHVRTADVGLLPKGTGYITDLGMTGPAVSVLGIRPEQSISKFLGNPPQRYKCADGGCKLECAIFELDGETGRCISAQSMCITD